MPHLLSVCAPLDLPHAARSCERYSFHGDYLPPPDLLFGRWNADLRHSLNRASIGPALLLPVPLVVFANGLYPMKPLTILDPVYAWHEQASRRAMLRGQWLSIHLVRH